MSLQVNFNQQSMIPGVVSATHEAVVVSDTNAELLSQMENRFGEQTMTEAPTFSAPDFT